MVVELIFAGVCGFGAGCFLMGVWAKRALRQWEDTADLLEADRELGWTSLLALRSNCFITNERGHRVRYVNASVECRAKAEAPKEATGWRVP